MSEIDPLADLLEHHRALLEEAEADIKSANAEHAATMARLQEEHAAANAKHQQALKDAVTRKMRAEGAIAALEELARGEP